MTTTETGTPADKPAEVVPSIPDATTGDLVPMTQAMLVQWLRGEDIPDDDNSDELTYEMALKILGADSPEAALAKDDVRKVASLVGTGFAVRSVQWRRSTKSEDGAGRYAVMQCVDADGVAFLSSCGATKVVLQLRKAQLAGWLPWKVSLDATETSNNRTVYELVPAPEDF